MHHICGEEVDREIAEVAVKAFGRICADWGLTPREAAALAGMTPHDWARHAGGETTGLSRDVLMRISAAVGIHLALARVVGAPRAARWMTRPNTGPLFAGARPIDVAMAGDAPTLLSIRSSLEALSEGL